MASITVLQNIFEKSSFSVSLVCSFSEKIVSDFSHDDK